jgi:hypothetical protein
LTDTHSLPSDSEERALDPFGFIPHLASRIIGLGGDDASSDATYAFHTPYVSCAAGPVTFFLRFSRLEATHGNLTLRINAISTAPGAVARTVKMTSRALAELADTGVLQITIESKPNLTYAALGLIYGPSDASADELQILIDNPGSGDNYFEQNRNIQYTKFGHATAVDVSRLASNERATLADPVSQFCTSSQFNEPSYHRWLFAMKAKRQDDRRQWETIYSLSVLECYGMLQHGARGLGFASVSDPMVAVIASMGCTATVTDHPGAGDTANGLAPVRYPEICSDRVFDEGVSFVPSISKSIPGDLRDFDFCWSTSAFERFDTLDDGMRFVVESLQCLKVHGIAVHTMTLNLADDTAEIKKTGARLQRSSLERLALELVSYGHQVAQLKYDCDHRHSEITSVGLIVRKGESNFY